MEERLEFTRTELAEAFKTWFLLEEENPEDFEGPEEFNGPQEFAEAAADYLIELLNQ